MRCLESRISDAFCHWSFFLPSRGWGSWTVSGDRFCSRWHRCKSDICGRYALLYESGRASEPPSLNVNEPAIQKVPVAEEQPSDRMDEPRSQLRIVSSLRHSGKRKFGRFPKVHEEGSSVTCLHIEALFAQMGRRPVKTESAKRQHPWT